MKIITTISKMQAFAAKARRQGKQIGFVPTMGYLHLGHASLLKKCKKENPICVLSIFVNPTQFGPNEDYRRYPRNKKHDEMLAKKEKVDIIFYPSVKEMYPSGYLTYVSVEKITNVLCGHSRPGHFRGVVTIVAKLMNAISPDILYLGQKDAQQVAVIKQMVSDLRWPTRVNVVPTVREKDGLALSSRNRYLSPEARRQAVSLYQSLCLAQKLIAKGERDSRAIIQQMTKMIKQNSLSKIDYISCVDAKTLLPVKRLKGDILIALAVFFGKTRLIDNILIST
jgi:pantoate--beta-alanine ligase